MAFDETDPPFEHRRYDPRSLDSMISKVISHLEQQDATLQRIEAGVAKTNGRVTVLEFWRAKVTAKTFAYASAVSTVIGLAGWVFDHWAKIVGP